MLPWRSMRIAQAHPACPCRGRCDMTRTAALSVLFGILAFWLDAVAGGASQQERVDHRTQVALSLDAHRSNGKVAYTHFCTECHGARALGNSQKGVPALAGQRYAYL